jgi:hypothetical protein
MDPRARLSQPGNPQSKSKYKHRRIDLGAPVLFANTRGYRIIRYTSTEPLINATALQQVTSGRSLSASPNEFGMPSQLLNLVDYDRFYPVTYEKWVVPLTSTRSSWVIRVQQPAFMSFARCGATIIAGLKGVPKA